MMRNMGKLECILPMVAHSNGNVYEGDLMNGMKYGKGRITLRW